MAPYIYRAGWDAELQGVLPLIESRVNASDPEHAFWDWLDRLVGENEGPGRRMLDVGCGMGRITLRYGMRFGECLATDPDSDRLGVAMSAARRCSDLNHVSFLVCSGVNIPGPPQSFDFIVLSQVVQHVPTEVVSSLLKRLRDLLTPAGVLVVSTTLSPEPGFEVRLGRTVEINSESRVVSRGVFDALRNEEGLGVRWFDRRELRNELSKAGLDEMSRVEYSYWKREAVASTRLPSAFLTERLCSSVAGKSAVLETPISQAIACVRHRLAGLDPAAMDGHVSLSVSKQGGIRAWRCHFSHVMQGTMPLSLAGQLATTSGVRLRLWTNAKELRITCTRSFAVGGAAENLCGLATPCTEEHFSLVISRILYDVLAPLTYDCLIDGRLQATRTIEPRLHLGSAFNAFNALTESAEALHAACEQKGAFDEKTLPSRTHVVMFHLGETTAPRTVEVWLPTCGCVSVDHVAACAAGGAGLVLTPASPDTRPRWLVYGSSITQGSGATSPTRTWPATAARLADVRLLSLGAAGECHLDQCVARMIRDMDSIDAITLELGINVHLQRSFIARTFSSAVLGFLATVRDGHPATPLVIVSPIACPSSEDKASSDKSTLSLATIRSKLADIVAKLRAAGDTLLFYRSGLDLLSIDEATAQMISDDGIHPTSCGLELIGQRFAAMELSASSRLRDNGNKMRTLPAML